MQPKTHSFTLLGYLVTFVYLTIAPIGACGDTPESTTSTTEKLRQRFISETDGAAKGKVAIILFQGAAPQVVNQMTCDDNDGLALTAAWHRVTAQVGARFQGTDRGASLLPIPREIAQEFVGFTEGRLRIIVPDSWLKCVMDMRFNRQSDILLPVQLYAPGNEDAQGIKSLFTGRTSQPRVVVKSAATPIVISVSGGAAYEGVDGIIEMPAEASDASGALRVVRPESVSCICTQERGIVAIQDKFSPGGYCYCISTRRPLGGQPLLYWKRRMDALWCGESKGATQWFTEMRIRGPNVYLFHCSDISFGVEGIAIATGDRVFSFNAKLGTRAIGSGGSSQE